MAKFNKDSFGGTVAVVLAVSLLCSIVVSGAAVGLKNTQDAQKALDKQKNILRVAGLLEAKTDIPKVYAERIQPKIVNLETGEYVEGIQQFDMQAAAKDPKQSMAIPKEQDFAGIQRRANYAEVYLVKDEANKVNQVILPIKGNGLWSTMYGLVSLKTDGTTVNGITYYEHGETPGLGGEISNPIWQQKFVGKQIYNDQKQVAIHIGKGASADTKYGVDALSGASMTSKGVDNTFKYWFSQNGYGPYLDKIKAGAQ
ncbi:Na(+)-translocating NADH-quinone reductase subunit C [Pelistega indica]|uniref:Na(+)-translocating NADH-quinone reductase subunit C n=1 Tax=Pelistega indica TaxID=1414851 RepID=V8G844_9BURK|nr:MULTISPECIES: Na(+)-translocating NADH-quinone reductase subunit C [Pelistega]ETD72123.1 Na(+)-translocating NADH-quinone reductase subunit C [Pelistega indica]